MVENELAHQLAVLCNGDSDRDDVYAASVALRDAGPAADAVLLKALSDDTRPAEARSRVAGVLADRRVRDAVPLLVACLKSPSEHLRWSAATALGQIGDRAATPALELVASTDAGELTLQPGFTIRVSDAARSALAKLR
jgi:HEAT repeat protein